MIKPATPAPIQILLAALIFSVAISAHAQASAETRCGNNVSLPIAHFGTFSENELQFKLDKAKHELYNVRRIHHRGYRWEKINRIKKKIAEIQEAEQSLYDKLYLRGCTSVRQRASLNARVAVLEKEFGSTLKNDAVFKPSQK